MFRRIINLNSLQLVKNNSKLAYNLIQCNRVLNTTYVKLGIKGIEIKMPVLSPTMTQGNIKKWHKNEGDKINPGDLLCEVETDKAVVGMEIEEEGILAKILVKEDSENIQIGKIIALMVEEGENWNDVDIPSKVEQNLLNNNEISNTNDLKQFESKDNHLLKITPSVRNLLDIYNIDISNIKPTGPKNNHLKIDILNYIEMNKLKIQQNQSKSNESNASFISKETIQTSANNYLDIELSNMRRTIAKRLTESKTTIPHAYLIIKTNLTRLLDYQMEFKKKNIPVSINDFIIKAAALALKKVPKVNSIYNSITQNIELLKSVDVSIAVATDTGLITPIIKNANQLSLKEINQTVKNLANKARAGKLQPNEFIGGSFSISNLGMFNISEFSAVINPPQTAILAVGSAQEIVKSLDLVDKVLKSTLSFDARVLDLETVADFLETYSHYLEEPSLLESSGDGSTYRQLNYYLERN